MSKSDRNSRTKVLLFAFVLLTGLAPTGAAQDRNCSGSKLFDPRPCAGDEHSQQELELIERIGRYRTENGKPAVTLSPALAKLANRRTLDLKNNIGSLTHSWSNCRYSIADESTWHCVLDAPTRLKTGFDGHGFEVLYRTTNRSVVNTDAIDAWKRSELHNSIILNLASFADREWTAIGISIDGPFAAVWFGAKAEKPIGDRAVDRGLGVTFDQAVNGLANRMSIKQVSTTIESTKWSGRSPNGKLRLDIFGKTEQITEAEFRITSTLDPDRRADQTTFRAIVTFLTNVFIEWPDSEEWLRRSIAEMSVGESASRTKALKEATVELNRIGSMLTIVAKPKDSKKAVEIF